MRTHFKNGPGSFIEHMFFNIVSISNQTQEVTDDTQVMQAVLMSCMISVTGTGNALVILGFVANKNLRTPSNYFLLNLAISDFFTGTFSLPLYLKNFIINGGWILGKNICKLWLTIDYTLCQCTIYNIVLISYDRFMAVTKAVKYRDQQNKIKPAIMKMAAVWIIAFLNFGPAIIFWEYVVGYSLVPDGECNPEFYYHGHYLLYSSFFDFFTPMTAIAFFNLSIYFNIRSRMKNKGKRKSTNLKNNDIFVLDSTNAISNDVPSTTPKNPEHLSTKKKKNIFELCVSFCKNSPDHSKGNGVEATVEVIRHISQDSAKNAALSKDKKIAKSLAIIVCTFCICWAPYSFLTIIREGFCEQCISPLIYNVTCWFFFLNSLINPFLYPFCLPAFKKTLMQLLCIKDNNEGIRCSVRLTNL